MNGMIPPRGVRPLRATRDWKTAQRLTSSRNRRSNGIGNDYQSMCWTMTRPLVFVAAAGFTVLLVFLLGVVGRSLFEAMSQLFVG